MMKRVVLLIVVLSTEFLSLVAAAADALGGSPPGCC
jgi:hypothetical protein